MSPFNYNKKKDIKLSKISHNFLIHYQEIQQYFFYQHHKLNDNSVMLEQ